MDSKPKTSQQLIVDSAKMKLEISLFPQHNPEKFHFAFQNNQIDKVYEQGEQIGFLIKTDQTETFYELDDDFGYFEPNGCYYNQKNQPAGWWVKTKKGKEHFYNIDGYLEAIEDDETQKQSIDYDHQQLYQFDQQQFYQKESQQFETQEQILRTKTQK